MVQLAAAYGTELDDWQVDAREVCCGVRDDGLWSAPTVGLNIARQNGKSVILVVRALAGPLLFGEKTVIVSVHQQKTSRLFQNVESFFANFSDLTKRSGDKNPPRAVPQGEVIAQGIPGDQPHYQP